MSTTTPATAPATLPEGLTIPATPDAAFLSKVLRDPSLWPKGFEWNYFHHKTCALGLVFRLWPETEPLTYYEIGHSMGLSHDDARDVFFRVNLRLEKAMRDVTPTDVADALDATIAGPTP